MPKEPISLAVKSLQKEQNVQRANAGKDALEQGLEDSFPASDPVSNTTTSVSAGRTDSDEAEKVRSRKVASKPLAENVSSASPRNYIADIKETIRTQPITAVAIVAAIAYIWGATR